MDSAMSKDRHTCSSHLNGFTCQAVNVSVITLAQRVIVELHATLAITLTGAITDTEDTDKLTFIVLGRPGSAFNRRGLTD